MAHQQTRVPADETYDVIVVGFGGAGASAAIAAADAGASVLVLERSYGGGSTAHSGGVVYAGGGTDVQQSAGVSDSPEEMLAYLKQESGGVVSDETLRTFAEGSPKMIDWLRAQGLEFDGSLCDYKTSYPTNRHYLYYSGNELTAAARAVARPAARGHRVHAKNFTGAVFYAKLRESALRKGVTVRPLADVRDLIVEDGTVVGVEFAAPAPGKEPGGWHKKLAKTAGKMMIYYRPVGSRLSKLADSAQRRRSQVHRARARGGVVLATGGFGFDMEMVSEHAPQYAGLNALGPGGENGSAVKLGAQVQAATDRMDSISGWRFICPPSAFMEGIVVDGAGQRFTNEQLYGATMTKPLIEEHGGRGFVITDAATWRKARGQIRTQSAFFHLPQLGYVFSPFGHHKANTLEKLARSCKIDPAGLIRSAAEHDAALASGEPDAYGKNDEFRHSLGQGPYYAVNIGTDASRTFYPLPFITLGGLVVDEGTGGTVRESGEVIAGLYAAGRSAVGICSNSYVSGLSLADAVFSGRRAGEHAAGVARSGAGAAAGTHKKESTA
ncbi:FAD-binding protein [Streptomyces sp. NBC_00554]|uniref:FAD-binding protein n=1 Tax=Streptomyces sp. NBC_00554 TaxID=2903661 RepID=UPI00352F925C|nr:FAD-binding protein [Streptomyces sp. NBC_00554]